MTFHSSRSSHRTTGLWGLLPTRERSFLDSDPTLLRDYPPDYGVGSITFLIHDLLDALVAAGPDTGTKELFQSDGRSGALVPPLRLRKTLHDSGWCIQDSSAKAIVQEGRSEQAC